METQKLLQADYLDIIFDKRNKNYGGYELRKHYNRRLAKGVLLLLLVVAVLSSFSFIGNEHVSIVNGPVSKPDTLKDVSIHPPIVPPQKIIPPPAAPKPQMTRIFTAPVITDDPIKPDEQMTENKTLANATPGITNTEGDAPGIAPAQPGKEGTGVVMPPSNEANKPFLYVQQMPQFDGNIDAYIGSHLQYPAPAHENGIEGRVIIQFVVNEDGAISNATIIQGIGGGCDEEALRMVNGMPKWKPGRQNGIAVKVYFKLPIRFVLR